MVTRVVHHFEHDLAVFVGSLFNRPAELYLRLCCFADAVAGAHHDDQISLARRSFILVVTENAACGIRIGCDGYFPRLHQDR